VVKIASRILSPTAINTYLSCPRKFYLRYIKRLPGKASIHLIRGGIVHRAIRRFHQEHRQPWFKTTPLEIQLKALQMFEEEWDKAQYELSCLDLSPGELQEYRDQSQTMVSNFATWLDRHQMAPVKEAELRMICRPLGLMGIVDAVYGQGEEAVLVDYKTSKRALVTADIQRQAALYALLYQEQNGAPPKEVWIHFLNSDYDPEVIQVDDPLLDYGRVLVETTHRDTQSSEERDYPCTCGGWCERDFAD